MPIAEKDGSIFIGWYTSKDGPNDPLGAKITSITPITKDITAYACYEVAES